MDKTIKIDAASDTLPFDEVKLPNNPKAWVKMIHVMEDMTGKVTFKRPEGK